MIKNRTDYDSTWDGCYRCREKATYQQIKDYVLDKFGLKVSSLNIAQIKDKCGIKERKKYNTAKSESSAERKCTPEKEKAILDAFRYFAMI